MRYALDMRVSTLPAICPAGHLPTGGEIGRSSSSAYLQQLTAGAGGPADLPPCGGDVRQARGGVKDRLMAKTRIQFICQACGNVTPRWAGKCDACGEWNTLVEEGTSGGIGGGPSALRSRAQGPAGRADHAVGRHRGRAAHRLRHRRARPRHRRRLRARLGAAGRRRSRHRQVDAADAGRGGARRQGPPRRLRLRRGGGGADQAAGAAARRRRRAGRARRRNQCRGHPRHHRRRQAARPRHPRFDPDAVDRHRRIRRPAR